MSMTLSSFGVVFLSFGAVMLFLGFLGFQWGTRTEWGMSALLGIPFLVIGAVLFGAGFSGRRRA